MASWYALHNCMFLTFCLNILTTFTNPELARPDLTAAMPEPASATAPLISSTEDPPTSQPPPSKTQSSMPSAQSSPNPSPNPKPTLEPDLNLNLDIDIESVASFKAHLAKSKRIIAIIGAGLSVASGVPTFRDSQSPWMAYDSFLISSPAGWKRDPGLVWQFYSDRRREALAAKPNAAHHALVSLARRTNTYADKWFVALSQNVDGLLERAGLVPDFLGGGGSGSGKSELIRLHGDLFSLKCAGGCGYVEHDNLEDPVYGCEVLTREAIKERMSKVKILGANRDLGKKPSKASALLFEAIANKNKKILGEEKFVDVNPTKGDAKPLSEVKLGPETAKDGVKTDDQDEEGEVPSLHSGIDRSKLPQCPSCKKDLLRPALVWFGEALPEEVVLETDDILDKGEKIDLCLVIGTSSQVWPAAGFSERARARGARIAWVNTRMEDCKMRKEEDWVFLGDAGVLVPILLEM